jgi:hypothetical protein
VHKVIPLQMLLEYLTKITGYDWDIISTIEVTVPCLKLANLTPGQFTPRTKFYAVKAHWFQSKLSDKRCNVMMETKFRHVDILTKSLGTDIWKIASVTYDRDCLSMVLKACWVLIRI